MPKSYRAVAVPPAPSLVCFKCGKPGHFAKTCPANTFPSPRIENKGRSYAAIIEAIPIKSNAPTAGHMKQMTFEDIFRS